VILGGEALTQEMAEQIRELGQGCEVINHYGPTETTVGSLTARVSGLKVKDRRGASVPIGRPIGNTKTYVLDRELEPVPVGVRGELYISGVGVARGYRGKPEQTAERFIANVHGGEEGDRLYRTGDVCRYLSDGKIEYIGRSDDQVKVRGYRIELGEIQAVLEEQRSVKQSVVIASQDERGGKRLVGYVVCKGATTSAELKRALREKLPEYMVPEAILTLDEMPLTRNGKVDRKRLPSVKDAGRQGEQEYVGARTPVEEIAVGIFEEVLRQDRVGVHDNFFEIGGHSLLATQVISRVRNTFGVEIGVGSVFEEPTVESLARRIEEAIRRGEKVEAPPLVRVSREGQGEPRLPLSFAQQRLWFLDQLVPNDPFYNCPRAVRLEGRLDPQALERSINEIIRRHEVLRTRIEVEAGEPVQVIEQWKRRSLQIEDLTSFSQEEREQEARRITKQEAATGFDLSRGPLLRVKVLKLAEEERIALFTTHHIVSDAWTMGILIREVGALYRAYSAGEPSPLPELEIQYADFAVWQRNFLQGEALERQLGYWRKQLAGLEPLELPLDYPRPAVAGYRGANLSFELSQELTESLKALSRREGVTLFMTLLAAFKTLLYKYTAQEDIIVGTAVANRSRVEVEPLIGFFLNMLPLRTDLSGNPGFTELLKRVRDVAIGGYAHQDMPFEKLVKEIQPERTVREMPLFNVAFGVQNAPEEELKLNGIEVRPIVTEQGDARYDLTLWVREGIQGLRVNWTYSKDLFEEGTIVRMQNHFETLLSSIIDRPDARLSILEISDGAETGPAHNELDDPKGHDNGTLPPIRRRGTKLPTQAV
jgi:acyl carrier protein